MATHFSLSPSLSPSFSLSSYPFFASLELTLPCNFLFSSLALLPATVITASVSVFSFCSLSLFLFLLLFLSFFARQITKIDSTAMPTHIRIHFYPATVTFRNSSCIVCHLFAWLSHRDKSKVTPSEMSLSLSLSLLLSLTRFSFGKAHSTFVCVMFVQETSNDLQPHPIATIHQIHIHALTKDFTNIWLLLLCMQDILLDQW